MSSLFLSLLFFINLQLREAADIAFLAPTAAKSHQIVYEILIDALADKGHQITVISPYKNSRKLSNLHNVVLEKKLSNPDDNDFMKNFFSFVGTDPVIFMSFTEELILNLCKGYLEDPKVKSLLNSGQKFDLVIMSPFMNECVHMTVPLMSDTTIQIFTTAYYSWMFEGDGIQPLSFTPNYMYPVTDDMSFTQRVFNFVSFFALRYVYNYHSIRNIENTVWQHYPNALSIVEAQKLVNFSLFNADPVMIPPRPLVPNYIDVGGMHCKDAKPLPKDLKQFADSSGDEGFIYFSLGSNIQAKFLPEEIKKSFLNAFSRLKQKIIWKFEDDLKEKPKNVEIRKWLPQQDLLGDPHIRLFITHGGLLSLQESIYHGVPVVGIPLFADQPSNVERMKQLKIGEKLQFDQLTEENILKTINKVLQDKTYYENMKRYSAIFRDQPQSSVDRAVWWIEYVLRHKGAPHLLNKGRDYGFITYFSLDVITFLIATLFLIIFISFSIGKIILKAIRRITAVKKAVKKKTN